MAANLNQEVDDPLLTIVVPVHNMAGRLANLSMWLDDAQTHKVKVILVHDKSEDETGAELLQLLEMKSSQNFFLIETNVQSPGLSRNRGLEIVDTPWFSFVDSDDIAYIPSILNLIRETALNDCEIGVGSYISRNLISDEERLVKPPRANKQAIALHLAKEMGLWRFVLLTSSLGDIRFTHHKMGEDYLYTSLILDRTDEIYTSSEIIYKYFHGGISNLTSNKLVMSDMIGVIDLIRRIKSINGTAVAFRIFAAQKLTLSVLKNLKLKEKFVKKVQLSICLILNPIQLVKLVVSLKIKKIGF